MPKKRKKHQMKISSNLMWMAPYIQEAANFGIPIGNLARIKSYRTAKGKIQRTYGRAYLRGKKSTITLLDTYQVFGKKNGKIQVVGLVDHKYEHKFEFTLNTLAHELTHLIHPNHKVDRFIMECKLMVRFAELSKKLGYKGFA